MKFITFLKRNRIPLLFLLPSIFFLFNPAKFPADDGFFYAQIAHHIKTGWGITFNGIYDTNGFHPLWLLICTLLEFTNPFDKDFLLYLIWGTQITLVFFAMKKVCSLFSNKLKRILACGIISFYFFSLGTIYLFETQLCFFILITTFIYLSKNKMKPVKLGFLFGLLFLARLDTIFIIFGFSIFYLYKENFNIKKPLFSSLAFMALVTPYILWNYLKFDHIVPISGKIKSTFPKIQWNWDLYSKIFMGICILYLLLLLFYKTARLKRLKFSLIYGCIFYLFYLSLFQGGAGQWYWGACLLTTILFVGDFIAIIKSRFYFINKNYFKSAILCFVLFVSVVYAFLKLTTNLSLRDNLLGSTSKVHWEFSDPIQNFTKKLQDVLPKNEKLFVYDSPGKIAFYSQLSIIPSDGLINNFEFNKELTKHGVPQYFKQNNIRYILTPNTSYDFSQKHLKMNYRKKGDTVQVSIFSPIKDTFCGILTLNEKQEILTEDNPLKTWQNWYDLVTLWEID